ncbi:MAG TPA: serine hydrolase domain-containing protein [Phenylobacterium sp.]|nr:serine hydrolase domain-containing protein [Phenylobacterium sp.]
MTAIRAAAHALALTLLFGAAPALAETAPPALMAKLHEVVEKDGAPGVTAIVMKGGKTLYRVDVGAIAHDAQLPIASASKWMTGALVMTVVDEGKLSLDEPIGKRLPAFKGEQSKITLRELLSFTSGQGGLKPDMFDLRQDPHMTMAQAADQIAARPLTDPPGTVFRYGGPSLQVAGALVEQVTGEPWARLFQERIAGPLGLAHTYWGNALMPNLKPGEVRNPNMQAGVYTTAEDYAKFLSMLAAGGVYQGHRVLSRKAFDEMETLQTGKVTFGYRPPGANPTDQYALANWCETFGPSGRCKAVSSPGAFGTYPWIDRPSGLYGIFFLKLRLPAVAKDLREARGIVLQSQGATP